MLTALVCGDRNFKNSDLIKNTLIAFVSEPHNLYKVITGGCSGADTFGENAAKELCLWSIVRNANWIKYGKPGGPIRNREMLKLLLEEQEEKIVLAFHDDIKSSRGTKDMIGVSLKNNIEVILFSSNGNTVQFKTKEEFLEFIK